MCFGTDDRLVKEHRPPSKWRCTDWEGFKHEVDSSVPELFCTWFNAEEWLREVMGKYTMYANKDHLSHRNYTDNMLENRELLM